MKNFSYIVLVLLLLVSNTRIAMATEAAIAKAEAALAVAEAALAEAQAAVVEAKSALAKAATEKWVSLFDGESTAGWSIPVYGGDGEVDVLGGNLVIGRGAMMTGVRYEKEFPKVNYEIQYEARRTQGYDFFASCTFPVKESFCTFVNGGWGGGTTGLSSIDDYDASENPSSTYFDYRANTWHRFRIRVTDNAIQVWITVQDKEGNWGEEKSIINLNTEDKRLSTRIEVERYKPLGFCTWNAEGQLRNIEYRVIPK